MIACPYSISAAAAPSLLARLDSVSVPGEELEPWLQSYILMSMLEA